MADNIHPLTELLIARAKSHPEEFNGSSDGIFSPQRWHPALEAIKEHGTAADKEAIESTIGRLHMDRAHEWALDELMNGEERRREVERRKEEEEKRYFQQMAAMQQLQQQQRANPYYQNALQNAAQDSSRYGARAANTTLSTKSSITWSDEAIQSLKSALGLK